jgi:hypothetical protein
MIILLWPIIQLYDSYSIDQSLVDLIGHLVWPVTILILVFIFKTELINLINRLIEAPPGFKFRASHDAIRIDEAVPKKEFSVYTKSLLATLWKYQQEHYPKDPTGIGRWTFMVHHKSKKYEQFRLGLSECINAGLVGLWIFNNQVYLLDKGIEYCQENSEELSDLVWDLDFQK